VSLGDRIDRDDLLLDRDWGELRLLEDLDHPSATLQLGERGGVELGPELGEAASSRNWARLRRSGPAIFLIADTCAAPPTRDTEVPALRAGRMP
jgi:hypothetical protein